MKTKSTNIFIMKITRGAVFFDLGASIGNFSLFSAAHGLKTYAFNRPEEFRGARTKSES
jgi:hypothetical protein